MQALQSCCPEIICELRVIPYYDGHLMVHDYSMFDKWHKMVTAISVLLSQAIKTALRVDDSSWQPHRAFHAYCIRHMTANFMSRFKSVESKRHLINAAYSPNKVEYK
ncbi:hypothetical protein Ahy_A01g004634 [Arachis hypogaea]|uniref:Uncharacterized protein n=1 Tax=Arachis hypogaea TaxID=3818 RepID=A0A445EWP6_ARAHY|nr:hypothetical protein Ahy_A01g004634 [Arachis hypogaea]